MGALDDDRSQAPSVADENDEATTNHQHGEEEDTIDPHEEQQEIWAQAEGYTPLSDINYTSLMVSLGPDDDDDSDNDDVNDSATRDQTGAFFVNPSAFSTGPSSNGEEEDDNATSHDDASKEEEKNPKDDLQGAQADDFQNIADKALSLLDEEYERTLRGDRRPNSWKSDPSQSSHYRTEDNASQRKAEAAKPALEEEDMMAIVAAFDERKEVTSRGGFFADWNNLKISASGVSAAAMAASTNSALTTGTDATSPGIASVVDADAVRKAVAALSTNAGNNPFQQKFQAWQEKQQSLPPTHEIIPQAPYKAFRRKTENATRATASLSRSSTLAETLIRLRDHQLLPSFLPPYAMDTPSAATLTIDVVGVDHVECESIERIQSTFRPIVRWIGAWKGCSFQRVHLRLIGRDLTSPPYVKVPATESCSSGSGYCAVGTVDLLSPQTATVLQSAFATCHSGVYHEWLDSQQAAAVATATKASSSSSVPEQATCFVYPHLAIAYNAGIWGYKEWETTISYLSRQQVSPIPMVITAYTLEECQEDQEVIQEAVGFHDAFGTDRSSSSFKLLWSAQRNPFGSKVLRETKSSTQEYRENSSWQAWLLGGPLVPSNK